MNVNPGGWKLWWFPQTIVKQATLECNPPNKQGLLIRCWQLSTIDSPMTHMAHKRHRVQLLQSLSDHLIIKGSLSEITINFKSTMIYAYIYIYHLHYHYSLVIKHELAMENPATRWVCHCGAWSLGEPACQRAKYWQAIRSLVDDTHVQLYVFIYIYIYIHTYMYTYIYIHVNT